MKTFASDADAPARFRWLPPFMRPPEGMTRAQERTFLLVGLAALFAGYDQNVYGFAIPQIQASLHIPENEIGLTVTFFRLATLVAMLLALTADLVGRRRLLLVTIFGQGAFTLATAFCDTYPQFVWLQVATRIFGYAEEMLCIVVMVEEVANSVRGWAAGTLAMMSYMGAGFASLFFAFVTVLPGHWRALYVIGGASMLFVGVLRRSLPETKRFEMSQRVEKTESRLAGTINLLRKLASEYPGRIALILLVVSAFGFAIGPSTVLANTYLQKNLGFKPWQTTALVLPGGLLALWLNIMMGRLSDRLGRKRVILLMMVVAGLGYAFFYSGIRGWMVAPAWVIAYFAFFTADALMAALALEIVPTTYRATVGGLRYCVEIVSGGIALGLEGVWYDHFHSHGPAIAVSLAAIPISLIALLFLPEPAGRTLEEISHA